MSSKFSYHLNLLLVILCFSFPAAVISQEYEISISATDSTFLVSYWGGCNRKKLTDNYSSRFHKVLKSHFPDMSGRISYESERIKTYHLAQRKLRYYSKFKITLTADEQDAINYVKGTGVYENYQKLTTAPNIFDTRQSFLLKMHDPKVRAKFLKSYNRIN